VENGADKKEINARKLAEGQVVTQISGSGSDVLEMLAMLQRSVAIIMMEEGTPPAMVEIALLRSMETGLDLAVKDRSGK